MYNHVVKNFKHANISARGHASRICGINILFVSHNGYVRFSTPFHYEPGKCHVNDND